MGAFVVGAFGEDGSVDVFSAKGEEGGTNLKRSSHLIAHRVGIDGGHGDGAFGQSTHLSALDLNDSIVEGVAGLCSDILGVSVAIGRGELERHVVAGHHFDAFRNVKRRDCEHVLAVADEVFGEEHRLVENIFGREPVEVGASGSCLVGGIAEESEACAYKDGEVEPQSGLTADGLVRFVVERIVELRLAGRVINRSAQIDNVVNGNIIDNHFGRLESVGGAQGVLSPHQLLHTILYPHSQHGIGVLEDADAGEVTLLQLTDVHLDGA